MRATFYILCMFTFFASITTASKGGWWKKYSSFEESQLCMILTKGFDDQRTELHSRDSVEFVSDSKNIKAVQGVLEDIGKTPFDMYDTFIKTLQPGFAELSKNYYKEQRDSSGVSDEFNEFDTKFYGKLDSLTKLFSHGVNWNELEELSSKEVMCEAAFFYGLIDFERAITCLDAAPPVRFDSRVFSNFVADMYLGEASRPDFSFEGDVETRKWLDDMIKKYQGGYHPQIASLMRRFTQNIRGKVDNRLWNDYIHAVMTVHLSAALLKIKANGSKDLYDYLVDNRIPDEYMFASRAEDKEGVHAYLRTFKFDPSGETATMGIINSGEGFQVHDKALFNLSELPDTISEDPHETLVIRYIPFIVYDTVPRSDWGPAYTAVDSMDKAYFDHLQRKHEFDNYQSWQYIDDQRAGTCTAMSLWNALYWFERESQQNLESLRLTLYLEVLKEAAKNIIKLRTLLKKLGDQMFEMVDSDPARNKLQSAIKELNDLEDDYLRFFSVGFNSAIRSIRYLHTDPFRQGLNMTSIMEYYADFYESQGGEKYWQFVKPNIDDLFHSTYLRVIKPMIWVTPLNVPRISTKECDCTEEVNQTIKTKDPFNFVKAVISGTDRKCQSKAFLESIRSGIGELILQTHHQDLILRALAKEVHLMSGGRMPILRLVQRLISDYNFKLFPGYDIPSTEDIDFTGNIYQMVLFEDDVEMKQFAVNCGAFDLLSKNVLAAAYDLVKSAKKALPDLATYAHIVDTEEYKLHRCLVEWVATELHSKDPHIYAQHLANLIRNAEQTGIVDYIDILKLSEGWDKDDYAMLKHAAQENPSSDVHIKEQLGHFYNLVVGLELASKHPINTSDILHNTEYICAGDVSRAINANSPLEFVKAIISGVSEGCKSKLFLSSVTFGMDALKLQPHHKDLILRAFIWHLDAPQLFEFIDELITRHDFKLLPTDNTTPLRSNRAYNADDLFWTSRLENDIMAQRFATDLNRAKSNASFLLTLCTGDDDLAKLRPHFVGHVFEELQAMNPHLHAYHLSRLINQGALKIDDFGSVAFKPSTKWNDYDNVLIENAVIADPRREEYGKIFNFPTEYHINTENARKKYEFRQIGANPSDETLQEYATMLFKEIKDSYRK